MSTVGATVSVAQVVVEAMSAIWDDVSALSYSTTFATMPTKSTALVVVPEGHEYGRVVTGTICWSTCTPST